MPELPDVERFRRLLARHAKGHPILGVKVPDRGILRNTTAQAFGRKLRGRAFRAPARHGKWLFAPIDGSRVLLHFGMTGELIFTPTPRADGESPHDRVIFELDTGRLRYRSQRKLGGIWLLSSDRDPTEITGRLGPDAANVGRDEFVSRLSAVRGRIKSALMNQSHIAGLGNEITDEILWRAHIRPSANANKLSTRTLRSLYDRMSDVVQRSIRVGRIPTDPGWLHSVRGQQDAKCPRCAGRLERTPIGGRTTVWCPHCQPQNT